MSNEIKILSKEDFIKVKDDKLPRGYLSASQISKYLSCPMDYYFSYVEDKPFASNSRMIVGSATHKLIENSIIKRIANKDKLVPVEEILDDSRRITEEMYFGEDGSGPEDDDLDVDQVVDSAQKSFLCWYKNRMPVISPIQAEKEALFTINGIPIKGYIDYLDATPIGVKVVDIKVGKKKRKPEDSVQLGLYALSQSTPLVGFDTILQPTARLDTRLDITEASLPEAYLHHVGNIVTNVYKGITQGFFPQCLPDHWLCNPKWCGNFNECRGKQ